jgi:hypothetical protein
MIRLIRAGIIGLAGVFCWTVFAADSTSVKDVTKAGISEDILVDDNDEDLLKLSKDTTTAKPTTPVQVIVKDTANAVQPIVQKDSANIKKAGLDDVLILEGGADDLLGTTPKPKDTTVASVKTDTAKAGIIENKVAEPAPSIVVVEKPKTATAAPVKIENADSINFAKSLKNYRNPKIAMLLSLIFPGAGEVYAKNYVRAGIFGALEAGVIITGAVFNSKAKKDIDAAHDYADQHYSSEDLITFYSRFKSNFFPEKDSINEADSVFLATVNIKPSTFSKSVPDFYDIIADSSSPYIQGWKDVTPKVDENYNVIGSDYTKYDDSTNKSGYDSSYLFIRKSDSLVTYGSSQYQYVYNDKVSKANKKFKVSQNIFTLMILNRVASAIDAGICAKAYNDKLLGKKSAWQRINIKDITVASGTGLATGYALEVRF